MLFTLAWRNLWRNRRRTLITTASIFFAVLLSIFMIALQDGAYDRMIDNVVGRYTGYVQVHQKGYWDEQTLENTFLADEELAEVARQHPGVTEAAPRLESFALASSEEITKGCMVIGIDPEREHALTHLADQVETGAYLKAGKGGALVAKGLAEKLKLGIGDTLVLLGQGYHGVTAAGEYAIQGLLNFGSPELNKQLVYLELGQAQRLYGAENRLSSFAINLHNSDETAELVRDLRQNLDEEAYEVMDWKEMMPELVQAMEADAGGNYIFLGVLYMIVSFGIFGTILMMTAERMPEFGVMVGIGMKRTKLAITVVFETIMIAMLGVLAGMAASLPLVLYFNKNPIYMGAEMEEMYAQFGFEPYFPTSTDPMHFISQGLVVFIIASLIAIYPMVKVSKIDSLEAMRK
jgi:putative ABC transport system permease protein